MRKLLLGTISLLGLASNAQAGPAGFGSLSLDNLSLNFSQAVAGINAKENPASTDFINSFATNSQTGNNSGVTAIVTVSGTNFVGAGTPPSYPIGAMTTSINVSAGTGSNMTITAGGTLVEDINFTIASGATTLSLGGNISQSVGFSTDGPNQAAKGTTLATETLLEGVTTIQSSTVLQSGLEFGIPPPTVPIFVQLDQVMFPTLANGSYTLELTMESTAIAIDTIPLPTPEPSTLAVILAGLLGIGLLKVKWKT